MKKMAMSFKTGNILMYVNIEKENRQKLVFLFLKTEKLRKVDMAGFDTKRLMSRVTLCSL